MKNEISLKKIAVIVAHPDDETLWAGGSLLNTSFDSCFILSLCRGNDSDRAPRFFRALKELRAAGCMADLDDGPDQNPLEEVLVEKTIYENLPPIEYDRVYTHSPAGEYTRHRRHEETGKAVLKLWIKGKIKAREICLFAYEDGEGRYLPGPVDGASLTSTLSEEIWRFKYKIIREIYNFDESSFEAQTTPRTEAFWLVRTEDEALARLKEQRSSP